MISFDFKVTKPFLENLNHPITIPKDKYKLMINEIYDGTGERNQEIIILPPCGRRLDGHIYYGLTGHQPYYQIKVLGSYPSDYFGHLKIGAVLSVTIEKKEDIIQVFVKDTSAEAYVNEFKAASPEKQKAMLAELRNLAMKK